MKDQNLLAMNWRDKDCIYSIGDLLIHKSYRFLPKRRLTALAKYKGQKVIAKCFANKTEHLKEKNQYEALREQGFLLPALLADLKVEENFVLIFEFIENIQSWSSLSDNNFVSAFKDLITVFKKLHQSGWVHQDPHLDNFLVTESGIYLVDYGSFSRSYLFSLSCYWNFAYLLAQTYSQHHEQLPDYIAQYLGSSHSYLNLLILYLVQLRHWQRVKKYQKKVFRDCTEFKQYYEDNYFIVHKRALIFESELNFEALPVKQYFKQGNTATVWLSELSGRQVVIKRYNDKGLWWRLRHLFKKSRGRMSWQNASLIKQYGFNTPEPLIYCESRRFGLLMNSYYVSEYIPGKPAHLHVDEIGVSDNLISHLENLFSRMRRLKLCQTDAKASNLLISEAGDMPYLIDLDSVKAYRSRILFEKKWKKSWTRWVKNWQNKSGKAFELLRAIG